MIVETRQWYFAGCTIILYQSAEEEDVCCDDAAWYKYYRTTTRTRNIMMFPHKKHQKIIFLFWAVLFLGRGWRGLCHSAWTFWEFSTAEVCAVLRGAMTTSQTLVTLTKAVVLLLECGGGCLFVRNRTINIKMVSNEFIPFLQWSGTVLRLYCLLVGEHYFGFPWDPID